VGLGGLGVEIAKNVILAGVKSVVLYEFEDNCTVRYDDLSAQFYLSESDLRSVSTRAEISFTKLRDLNPYVNVSVLKGDLMDIITSTHCSAVVLTESGIQQQTTIAEYCHKSGVSVIIADVWGVFSSVFCDFGPNFVVNDTNGEPASSSMIASITTSTLEVFAQAGYSLSPSDASKVVLMVTVLEDNRHNLESGDRVNLSDIVGTGIFNQLNGNEFDVVVKNGDPFSFFILMQPSSTPIESSHYERGGYVNQIKKPVSISFKSFKESIIQPNEIVCDFTKCERALPMHAAFFALKKFQEKAGCLPEPGNSEHAAEVYRLTVEASIAGGPLSSLDLSSECLSKHEDVIKRLALCSRGVVGPMCALIGGVVGQEVLTACSGKFMPIKQWFYFDAVEALSDEPLPLHEVQPLGSRYDGQIAVFGRSMQQQLAELNMFLVGAGAIGCEMIKNWAMMGVSCPSASPNSNNSKSIKGVTYVTDMDRIEKSNLSRQFLFRNSDINQPKSTTAARAVTSMNPAFNAVAYENKVAPETEYLFNDDFFEGLDMVCTALDNVEARLYIDQKCMFYHKPMLESGTLGAKGHTQVVVPFKTENYGASRDPPEKSIPVCTLKHFPNQIDHTLQWAREWFEEVFKQTPEDVKQYMSMTRAAYESSLAAQQNMKLDTLMRIQAAVAPATRPTSFEHCVVWARKAFEDLFANRIKQLLHNFPLHQVTANGTPFWSGAKTPPTPIEFDSNDPLHLEFILSSALLLAAVYNIPVSNEVALWETTKNTLATTVVEKFKPVQGLQIPTTEEEAKSESKFVHVDIDEQCRNIIRSLPDSNTLGSLTAMDFDKDVDSHMRVVAAASNLRARNYKIPEADLHKSRGIAGKITPAIATTTAFVTGLICMELFKIVQQKEASKLMNTFSNLALPLFTSMEPEPPKVTTSIVKGKEWKWTQWDRIDVKDPSMTIDGLISLLSESYGVELSMLSSGVTILYSDFLDRKKMKERRAMPVKAVVESVTKKTIPASQKYLILEIIVSDEDTSEEVEIPYLRFKLY